MQLRLQLPRFTRPLHRRWQLRDAIAASALFLATAAVVLWQNAHVAVLWDASYTLDTSWRIALGQMPYRDFPFVHAPLPFLIQAAIIRLTGRVFFHHVLYAAIIGVLGTVLTWRIMLHELRERVEASWPIALLLAIPLTVLGLYCIVPHPSYDCDCAFSILVALWLLQRLAPDENASPQLSGDWLSGLAAGAAICLPLFFKQNMGLPFLLAVLGAALLVLGAQCAGHNDSGRITQRESRTLCAVLAGAAATLAIALLMIQFTVGLGNYLHWTIVFAGQRRLPGWNDMLGVYHDSTLLWTLPCAAAALFLLRPRPENARWKSAAAFVLLAAPFIYALSSLLLYDDADERGDSLLALWPWLLILAAALALWNLINQRRNLTLRSFTPFILLVAIHGTFLSQQLWGSTYGIWPLLTLLLAEMLAFLAAQRGRPGSLALGDQGKYEPQQANLNQPHRFALTALTTFIATTLFICGTFYTTSEERLSYADLPNASPQHSAFPALTGMSTPGPYLPDFDELLRYAAAHIPINDGLILLPGEDPFYYATGRVPQFPVLLFDPSTQPYSPSEIADLVRTRNIRWLIVKRNLQIKANPMPQREATLAALKSEFVLETQLHAYDIYRRP